MKMWKYFYYAILKNISATMEAFFHVWAFISVISSTFQRSRRHTVGILVGAFPCGIITIYDELYGSESLTQVHAILIEYLAGLPKSIREKLIEICYDDACHLKKFSENEKRANVNEVTRFMAGLGKHVDKFHFPNHVDEWCHKNCNPQDVRHLDGVNTPICEQLFSAINKFRNAKSMNEANFFLFFLYIFDLHNLNIEGKLSFIANPMSELRYEHIEMNKSNPVEDVAGEKANEVLDAIVEDAAGEKANEVDAIGEMLENMNVGDKEVDPLGKNDISKNTNHKCDMCGTEYKRFGFLKLHMKNKHEIDSLEARSELGVKCELCDIRYDEVKYLNRHNKIHHSQIICSWCNLECGDKENYDEHIMTHLHCDVCGKKFDKPSKLNRHLKTHV